MNPESPIRHYMRSLSEASSLDELYAREKLDPPSGLSLPHEEKFEILLSDIPDQALRQRARVAMLAFYARLKASTQFTFCLPRESGADQRLFDLFSDLPSALKGELMADASRLAGGDYRSYACRVYGRSPDPHMRREMLSALPGEISLFMMLSQERAQDLLLSAIRAHLLMATLLWRLIIAYHESDDWQSLQRSFDEIIRKIEAACPVGHKTLCHQAEDCEEDPILRARGVLPVCRLSNRAGTLDGPVATAWAGIPLCRLGEMGLLKGPIHTLWGHVRVCGLGVSSLIDTPRLAESVALAPDLRENCLKPEAIERLVEASIDVAPSSLRLADQLPYLFELGLCEPSGESLMLTERGLIYLLGRISFASCLAGPFAKSTTTRETLRMLLQCR